MANDRCCVIVYRSAEDWLAREASPAQQWQRDELWPGGSAGAFRDNYVPDGKQPTPYTARAARGTPTSPQQHVDVRELWGSSIRGVSARLHS